MSDERGRLALHQRLVEVLGEEAAVTLMDHLPPPGTEVVTRRDLQATETRIEQRFDRIDNQFDRVDDQFGTVKDRFDRVDDQFGTVNDRFSRIDDQFGRISDRFDKMDSRIDALEQRLDERMRLFIATTIAAVFSAVLATAGVVLAAGTL